MSRRLTLVVLAVALLAFVLFCAAVGARWLRRGFSARDEPSAMESLMARQARLLAVPRGARELKNPLSPSPELLAMGRAHFADHCALCHGNDGRGQTEIGKNLYPKAPDMTLAETQSLTDGELFYVIKNGVRLTGMPAWGGDTPADDLASWHLVLFIRHLPKITPVELQEMAGLNPVSPAELHEMTEEERFLEGGEAPAPDTSMHQH
jgi:mono/diheme cytochrome c family protein